MAQSTLHQILAQLPILQTDELRHLQNAVQSRLDPPPPTTPQDTARKRAAFHAALHHAGLVTRPPTPRPANTTPRRLRKAQGKPVSETILEERR